VAGYAVKQRTGGIRHDYKDVVVKSPNPGRWLLFVVGLSLPLVVVAVLILAEPRAPVRPAQPPVEQIVAVQASPELAIDVLAPEALTPLSAPDDRLYDVDYAHRCRGRRFGFAGRP
jgi:hypothetical protein